MHQRTDQLVDRVGTLEGNPAPVQEDVSEMRPATDGVRRWKLMGIGAIGVIGIGSMALGVTLAEVIGRILLAVLGR